MNCVLYGVFRGGERLATKWIEFDAVLPNSFFLPEGVRCTVTAWKVDSEKGTGEFLRLSVDIEFPLVNMVPDFSIIDDGKIGVNGWTVKDA